MKIIFFINIFAVAAPVKDSTLVILENKINI